MRRRVSPWQALAVAVLSVLTVLYLFPFYWMVVTALKPLVEFYRFPPTLLPVHATVEPFLSVLFARGYLVLLYTVFSLPLATWMLRGFLLEVPMEIEEAALVDGASRFYAFFKIVLPQLAPALLATGVITFALAWSEFMFAFILSATPRSQTFPIGVASLVTQFEIIWNEMAAVGTIAAVVPILLLLFARRYVIVALTFGAVREKA